MSGEEGAEEAGEEVAEEHVEEEGGTGIFMPWPATTRFRTRKEKQEKYGFMLSDLCP